MTAFDLIIFDLDGTLYDTAPDVHDCVNLALNQMDLPPVSLQQTMQAIGPGPGMFSKIILGEANVHRYDEYIQLFRPLYHQKCLDKTRPFQGIVELLNSLQDYYKAVATNKPTTGTTIILKGSGLFEYFNLVIGPDCVEHAKPAPDMVYHAAAKLNVPLEKTLLIGDTDNDILAANAAGCYSCLAGWGYSAEKNKLQKISDFYAAHPLDILNILTNSPLPVKKCVAVG
ncbi:MAG TPA: HAD-IA family hydrolase [bacterium]|nr:HAD-IA family hydrolase [bacterium]HPN42601.1 HAD-IA family hydrolase [bacterium]